MSNTDTLDSLSTLSRNSDNTGLFLTMGFIVVGLISYLIFRRKVKSKLEALEKEENNSVQITEPSKSETKEETVKPKVEIKAVQKASETDKQIIKKETLTPQLNNPNKKL